MHLARVKGRVVATRKHEALEGVKLLLIQPVDHADKPKGEPIIATDPLQAGEGDLVAYVVGREASLALDEKFTPVDAGIVEIIDSVNAEDVEK
ncbi:MAG: EutN/CcmL family microcompartment protein [Candidatus Nitrospinota bacterium M3_3B_026]